MSVAPAPPSSKRTRAVALAAGCGAHVVQDGLTATIYVLLPILAQAFGFNYAQVGLLKAVKSLAQGLLEIYSGILSERAGEVRTLVVGLICAGIGYALLMVASEIAVVILCLAIVGIGTALQHAPASAIVSTAYRTNGRRGALGLYNSSGDVGKLAFSGAFSLAVGAGLAWQQVVFAYGLIALVAAAAIGLALPVLRQAPRAELDSGGQGDDAAAPVGWGILDRQSFGALLVAVFLDNLVQAGVLVFVAFVMIGKGFALYVGMLAPVLVLTGGIFGKAGCGFLADRIGVRRAFVLIQILTAGGLVALVILPGWHALVLLPLLGVVTQGSTSITYGIVADLVHPERAARGFALMYGSTSIASAAGPFLIGAIGDRLGLDNAVVALALISLLAIPPIALLANSSPTVVRNS